MKALELKIPPAAQFLIVAAGMWLIANNVPSLAFAMPARKLLLAVFLCLGGLVAMPAIAAFRAAGTTVDPRFPDKASGLVVGGVICWKLSTAQCGRQNRKGRPG